MLLDERLVFLGFLGTEHAPRFSYQLAQCIPRFGRSLLRLVSLIFGSGDRVLFHGGAVFAVLARRWQLYFISDAHITREWASPGGKSSFCT
jgi:hypothetical protein